MGIKRTITSGRFGLPSRHAKRPTNMRFVHSLLALLLTPIFVVATFNIEDHVSSDGVVYANDQMLDQILANKRDYTVALLLSTTNDRFGCHFCNILGPDYHIVASSWRKKNPDGNKLYFVFGEFEECTRSFQKLSLTSVPSFKIYLPNAVPRGVGSDHLTAEFKSTGNQVGALVGLLGQQGFHVEIVKPFPWERVFRASMTIIAVLIALVAFWDVFKRIITSRQPWIAFSVVTVLLFTAGQMFNITRGTPLLGQDNGKIVYFQSGFGNQLAIETQIIAILYAVLSFLTISLIAKVPRITNPKVQLGVAVALALSVYVGYSYFIAIYRVKYYGYPYGLLPVSI